MAELNIVPECYVDTKVAEIVGYASRKYNHQHGCGDVANQLKNKLKDKIALGIIDEDKNKGPIANYFFEFQTLIEENDLILKQHNRRKHFLILVCPEIEKWLLGNAKAVNINPANFNLPNDLYGIKQITKIQDIDKNIGFYQFIKALLKNESPGIVTLKKWIKLFNEDRLPLILNK